MAYREFEDLAGRAWRVWDVHPSHAERRITADRREDPRAVVRDRRRQEEPRILMAPELLAGWLCFEADGDRRRLVPVPPEWELAPVHQLRRWLDEAAPAPRRQSRDA